MAKLCRIGLNSGCFPNMSAEEVIRLCARCHIGLIDWSEKAHVKPEALGTIRKIAETQRSFGVKTSAYASEFNIESSEPEKLCEYLKVCGQLGTEFLSVECGTKAFEDYSDDEKQELYDRCLSCAFIAQEYSVVLIIRVKKDTFLGSCAGIEDFCDNIAGPNMRLQWETDPYYDSVDNIAAAKSAADFSETVYVANKKGERTASLSLAETEWHNYLNIFREGTKLILSEIPDGSPYSLPGEFRSLKRISDYL